MDQVIGSVVCIGQWLVMKIFCNILKTLVFLKTDTVNPQNVHQMSTKCPFSNDFTCVIFIMDNRTGNTKAPPVVLIFCKSEYGNSKKIIKVVEGLPNLLRAFREGLA